MRRGAVQSTRFVLLSVGAAVFVLPLAWMFVTAIKPVDQTMTMPPSWVPVAWTLHEDGEAREPHIDPNLYAQAITRGDATVLANFAFQWGVTRDGVFVPVDVPPAGARASSDVTARAHWRSADHDGQPVRIMSPMQTADDSEPLRIYVFPEIGFEFPATVLRDRLALHFDTTDRDVKRSFSVDVPIDLDQHVLEKRHVAWDDRSRLAFVHTEARPVPTAALNRHVGPRWNNFGDAVVRMERFPRYLMNTLLLCFLTVVGTTASSAMVAYGFSRIDWPGRETVFLVVLATMMIPFPVIMVPLYALFRDFGWIGTLRPLWVPAFFASAFNIFLLRQFFRTIPLELSEAARIDGCSELRIFLQIIVPLAKPALVVVAIFQFLATWNDFLGPLIFLTDQNDFTLALGLQFFQSQHGGTPWHLLMAASGLIVAPVIALFFFAQRTFVEGVATSGLKG